MSAPITMSGAVAGLRLTSKGASRSPHSRGSTGLLWGRSFVRNTCQTKYYAILQVIELNRSFAVLQHSWIARMISKRDIGSELGGNDAWQCCART